MFVSKWDAGHLYPVIHLFIVEKSPIVVKEVQATISSGQFISSPELSLDTITKKNYFFTLLFHYSYTDNILIMQFWYLISEYNDWLLNTSDTSSVYKKILSKLKTTSPANKNRFIPDLWVNYSPIALNDQRWHSFTTCYFQLSLCYCCAGFGPT